MCNKNVCHVVVEIVYCHVWSPLAACGFLCSRASTSFPSMAWSDCEFVTATSCSFCLSGVCMRVRWGWEGVRNTADAGPKPG